MSTSYMKYLEVSYRVNFDSSREHHNITALEGSCIRARVTSVSEVFWAGQHQKSGIVYAARYNTDKMVATGQVASTGMVALGYV
ncbi:hypothetical protein MTR67_029487 [Solanum verrucosum]|uniref:Uncharacterized protein n=1 Tax=Solanum verrucosum TaxID=315347 RepID=A0AAF0R4D5_SOLVR|nr:hypothetical protein MTR67_029487 [Solanum verrucosum]